MLDLGIPECDLAKTKYVMVMAWQSGKQLNMQYL